MADVLRVLQTSQVFTTPMHQQANGQVERFMATMKDMLATTVEAQMQQWPEYVPALTYAYNCRAHKTTGLSPYYTLFGRHPPIPLQAMLPALEEDGSFETPSAWVHELRARMAAAAQVVTGRREEHRSRLQLKNRERRWPAPVPPGTKVWLYRPGGTAQEEGEAMEEQKALTLKALSHAWDGPFEVLAWPTQQAFQARHGGVLNAEHYAVMRRSTVYLDVPRVRGGGVECKQGAYHRDLTKPYVDGVSGQPTGLPDGFARYHIRYCSAHWGTSALQERRSVTDGEVGVGREPELARIVKMRWRKATGQPLRREYCVRWAVREGGSYQTWEWDDWLLKRGERAAIEAFEDSLAPGALNPGVQRKRGQRSKRERTVRAMLHEKWGMGIAAETAQHLGF